MSNSDIWKVTITPRFVLILTPSSLPASLRYLQPPHPPKKTNLPLAYHEPHFSQSLLNLPLLTKSNLVSAFKSTPPSDQFLTPSLSYLVAAFKSTPSYQYPLPLTLHFLSPPSSLPLYPFLPISIALIFTDHPSTYFHCLENLPPS